MKKVLVVGFIEYGMVNKLADKYPDVIWLHNDTIKNTNKPNSIAAITGMVDEVAFGKFVSEKERLAWEVACVMMRKDVGEITDYPLDENKGEEA